MYVNSWEMTTIDRICWHAAVSNEMAEPSYKQTSSTRPKDVLGMVSGPQDIPVGGVFMLVLHQDTGAGPE